MQSGGRSAESQLIELVQHELHRMAERYMHSERSDHTLQPTALVNEVYIRLLGDAIPAVHDRSHFFALAAQAMRRILTDSARATRSQKRGGGMKKLELDEPIYLSQENAEELINLDLALTDLARLDERQSRIVEMRFFAGLSEEEISEVLNISVRTVRRDWRVARAWLYAELTSHSGDSARQEL